MKEADRRLVDGVHFVAHARARVHEDDQIDGHRVRLEELDVLLDTVLVDGEVGGLQPGDVARGAVEDGDVERHEAGAAAEHRRLRTLHVLSGRLREQWNGGDGRQERQKCGTPHNNLRPELPRPPSPTASRVPRLSRGKSRESARQPAVFRDAMKKIQADARLW